jgi:creatinine amidohydrolase
MQSLEFAALTAPALRSMAEQDAIVIVPIGAMEQHGPHLPVMVDFRLVTEAAMRAARKLRDAGHKVLVTPTVWTGFSEHHMELGGTVTIDFATFHGLMRGIVRSLVRDGFRRICLLNGHGGNIAPLTVVVSELTVELGVPLVTMCYFDLAMEQLPDILEHQTRVLHACEAETSMIMATEPHLVDHARLHEARGPDQDRPEIDSLVGPGVFRWQALNARARSGVIGNGPAATPEKGERLLEAQSTRVAEVLGNPALWSTRASDHWA